VIELQANHTQYSTEVYLRDCQYSIHYLQHTPTVESIYHSDRVHVVTEPITEADVWVTDDFENFIAFQGPLRFRKYRSGKIRL